MPALHQRSVASGWGGVATTGAGEESDHAVTGLGPGRPLCADDSYASGRGGCCSAMGATVTEMRDDCPDQYRGEGSLCRQRSSRRRLSTVSMRVKEGVSRAEESFYLDLENHQLRLYPVSSRYHP